VVAEVFDEQGKATSDGGSDCGFTGLGRCDDIR
jgi:hypothetical protein